MIKRPIISEKSMDLTKNGLYTFEVDRNASKQQIAKIVAESFKVDVVSVKSINVKGKRKLQRSRRGYFNSSPIKKALVQVKKGQKISLFENIGNEKEDAVVTKGEEEPKVLKEKRGMLGGAKVKIEKAATVKGQDDKKGNAKKKGEK